MQNESSPKFLNFSPEFCSEFPRIFVGSLRTSFRGKRRPEKNHQKSRHFSMQNSQLNSKKKSTKAFWRAGKVMILPNCFALRPFWTIVVQHTFQQCQGHSLSLALHSFVHAQAVGKLKAGTSKRLSTIQQCCFGCNLRLRDEAGSRGTNSSTVSQS